MTGEIWSTVAKSLAGPLLKPGARRVREAVLGPEHEQALMAVLRTTLEIVLDRLPASAGLERHERQHLQTVVEQVLGQAVAAGIFDAADGADQMAAAQRLLDEMVDSPVVDLTTFPVDVVELIAAFADELPVQLRLAAQRHASPIFEYVTQLQLEAIRQQLEMVPEAVARANLPTAGVREQATRAVQREINRRAIDDDLGGRRLVTSRALDAFDAYRDWPDWRESCQVLATRLGETCRHYREVRSVAAEIDGMDWGASFESVLQGLRELDLDRVFAELAQLSVQLRAGQHAATATSEVAARDCDNAASTARQLRRLTEQPRFEYCLTVVGQWGSGRSRLLLEIARRIVSSGHLAVFLEAGDIGPRGELLERAGRLLDSQFGTLGELSRFLAGTVKAKLFVLIDDADQWAYLRPRFLGELQELLTEASELDSLRWVITADEAHFDALSSVERPRFWERYGYARPSRGGAPDPSGWLHLDDLNVSQQLGLDILEAFANQRDRWDLATLRRDPQTFDNELRLLCNPLPAWLRLETDVGDDPPASGLIDVHRTVFVTQYWTRRKQTLTPDPQQRDELEQIATIAAQQFAGAGQGPVPLAEIVDAISSTSRFPALRDASRAEEGLALLRVGGLLRQVLSGDAEVDIQVQAVTPRLEVFWGHRIARRILADADGTDDPATELHAVLDRWGERAAVGERLAEAVVQFALVLLRWDGAQRRITERIWLRWLRDETLPAYPLWMAATAGPDDAQATLARWLAHSARDPNDKREVFALLRLVGTASTRSWSAPRRLELAKPIYRRVGEYGLVGYLARVVEAILERPDLCNDQNYVTTLLALSGIEAAGVAESAAGAAVRAGEGIFGGDIWAWLTKLLMYFQHSTRSETRRDFPRTPGTPAQVEHRVRDPDGTSAIFFWQHLARAACQALVRRRGLKAFHDLADSNWYGAHRDGVDGHVARRLRSEANVALGNWFREHRWTAEGASAYVGLVTVLTAGEALPLQLLEQREIAFFLIRHSTITRGRPGVVVDSMFHPSLRVLCADRRLHPRISRWLRATCEANNLTVR
jgi:hypothetical protein